MITMKSLTVLGRKLDKFNASLPYRLSDLNELKHC